jgi:hypothetical protein
MEVLNPGLHRQAPGQVREKEVSMSQVKKTLNAPNPPRTSPGKRGGDVSKQRKICPRIKL